MLYRFREAMMVEAGLAVDKNKPRPTGITYITSIRECEYWRSKVYREISQKMDRIQNTGLSHYELRQLNDEINQLFREKGRWEYRIKELGGKNYMQASRLVDNEGKEISGSRSYKYFGRARDLPGVKDLLEARERGLKGLDDVEAGKSKKEEQILDAEYYGVSEDVDEKLLNFEKTAELEWIEKEKQVDAHLKSQRHAQDASAPSALDMANASVETPLHVPKQTEVEAYLLERRKQDILNKYLPADLQS